MLLERSRMRHELHNSSHILYNGTDMATINSYTRWVDYQSTLLHNLEISFSQKWFFWRNILFDIHRIHNLGHNHYWKRKNINSTDAFHFLPDWGIVVVGGVTALSSRGELVLSVRVISLLLDNPSVLPSFPFHLFCQGACIICEGNLSACQVILLSCHLCLSILDLDILSSCQDQLNLIETGLASITTQNPDKVSLVWFK